MAVLKLKDGTRVPGATTIVGQMDKPFLVSWANKLGLKGINANEYRDKAAKEGTLIHLILESYLTKKEVDITDYTDNDLDKGTLAFNKFKEWAKEHTIEPLLNEASFVSEEYKFGGIIDFYCILDGQYTIIDFKTSKSVSNEQKLQVAAYVKLLRENNVVVDRAIVLDIPKEPEYELQVGEVSEDEVDRYFKLFKSLLNLYYVKKEIEWE